MTTYSDLDDFLVDLRKFIADIDGPVGRHIANAAAVRATPLARRAASADLGGDPKFSGWAPKLSISVKESRRGAVLHPSKTSAGPWTVAERGRHADGGVGRFQGPGVNMRTGRTSRSRKTGEVVVRGRRGGVRWNGMTDPKHTASEAVELFERHIPKYVADEYETVLRRRLG